jgi:hypothetical protein
MGNGDIELEYTVRKAGHVYDMINNKYLGKRSSWKAVMPVEAVGIYAVLPFKAAAPKIAVDEVKRINNGYYQVKVKVSFGREAAGISYPVRLTFTSPDGKKPAVFARTISVENASGTAVFTLPASAVKGAWEVLATEIFGGQSENTVFTIE